MARDVEDEKYVDKFRMPKYLFNQLHRKYGRPLEKSNTGMGTPIPGKKRLAILLHWLACGGAYKEVSDLYQFGHATLCKIVHEATAVLVEHLVPDVIVFPEQQELNRVMDDFESLCHLPRCCGAVDGTFMKIIKPVDFGDAYRCHKGYPAILILGCVDARGVFTNENSGRPGSVGDAFTFNRSAIRERIADGRWSNAAPKEVYGQQDVLYLVGDAAFALTQRMMKCLDGGNPTAAHRSFNYCVIRMHLVVEQAFGRMKGR